MAERNNLRLTPAEIAVAIDALNYWETMLEDERADSTVPLSHPLHRARRKLEEARRG